MIAVEFGASDLTCPRCGARPGTHCRTRGGAWMEQNHDRGGSQDHEARVHAVIGAREMLGLLAEAMRQQ